MTKEEADLIITEQNKSTEEILKAVAKVKSDYHELCELKDMRIAELKAQIEKMKCCANCKYFYCPTSSRSEKDGKVLFHNWNKERQAYCDCGNGEGEKYQLWEIKEK